ncbi:unnamed protein product, partial [Iphiclides podalirius]
MKSRNDVLLRMSDDPNGVVGSVPASCVRGAGSLPDSVRRADAKIGPERPRATLLLAVSPQRTFRDARNQLEVPNPVPETQEREPEPTDRRA